MNPHISLPRQHGGPPNFGGTTTPGGRSDGLRMPQFFKRWAFPSTIDLGTGTSAGIEELPLSAKIQAQEKHAESCS